MLKRSPSLIRGETLGVGSARLNATRRTPFCIIGRRRVGRNLYGRPPIYLLMTRRLPIDRPAGFLFAPRYISMRVLFVFDPVDFFGLFLFELFHIYGKGFSTAMFSGE